MRADTRVSYYVKCRLILSDFAKNFENIERRECKRFIQDFIKLLQMFSICHVPIERKTHMG